MDLLARLAMATVLTYLSVGESSTAHQPRIHSREGGDPEGPNNIFQCSADKNLADPVSDIILKFIGQLSRVRPSRRELSQPASLPHH